MDELQGWFNANSLVLNTEKTTGMLFHCRQERDLMEPQIKFEKIEIACKCVWREVLMGGYLPHIVNSYFVA
jgi:hypothetical protein